MDPNTASKRELMSLPGIGPSLAERIIQKRMAHKFEKVEDLLSVSGIGLRKLELIRPYIEIESVGYNTPEPAGTEDFLIRLAPTPPREPKCPYCQSPFEGGEVIKCAACQTFHHTDCWAENNGCACYGCGSTECSAIAPTLSDPIISQSTSQPVLDITLDIDSPRIQTVQSQDDNQEENTTLNVEIPPEEAEPLRLDRASQPETVPRRTRLWLFGHIMATTLLVIILVIFGVGLPLLLSWQLGPMALPVIVVIGLVVLVIWLLLDIPRGR